MGKIICDSDNHIFHKWSEWRIENAIFTLGLLYGKRAGQEERRQIRARHCEHCYAIDWKYLYA